MEVGAAFFGDEALESGFSIDEGGDDVTVAWFAFFEDDGVAIADVGVDHGLAADAEGEGVAFTADADGGDIDREATFLFLLGGFGVASGDGAVDGDVTDFLAVEVFGENDGASFSGEALDDAFFLKGAEVAHRGCLAGESEVVLDFAGGGHDAGLVVSLAEVVEDLDLTGSE